MPRSKNYLSKNKLKKINDISNSTEKKLFELQFKLFNADNTINKSIYNEMFLLLKDYATSMLVKKLDIIARKSKNFNIIPNFDYVRYIDDKAIDSTILFIRDFYIRKKDKPVRFIKKSFGGLLSLKVLNVMFGNKKKDNVNNSYVSLDFLQETYKYQVSEIPKDFNSTESNIVDTIINQLSNFYTQNYSYLDYYIFLMLNLLFLISIKTYTKNCIKSKINKLDKIQNNSIKQYIEPLRKLYLQEQI